MIITILLFFYQFDLEFSLIILAFLPFLPYLLYYCESVLIKAFINPDYEVEKRFTVIFDGSEYKGVYKKNPKASWQNIKFLKCKHKSENIVLKDITAWGLTYYVAKDVFSFYFYLLNYESGSKND